MSAHRSEAWTTLDEARVVIAIWRNRVLAARMLFHDGSIDAAEVLDRVASSARMARAELERLIAEAG